MKKEFVPYELSLKLKVLGFDEPCFGYYDGNLNLQFMYNGIPEKFTEKRMGPADSVWVGWISAPTYSQTFRWFREKYDLISSIYQHGVSVKTGLSSFEYMIDKLNNLGLSQFIEDFPYNTYEEAELGCLKKLIEIIEKQK